VQPGVLKVCDVRRSIPRRRRGTMHSLIAAHAGVLSQVIAAPQGCSWEHMDNFYNCLAAMCLVVGARWAEMWGRPVYLHSRQLVPVLTGGVAGCIIAGTWPK
jgi:hypothetical protein